MKILLNDYPEMAGMPEKQELDGTTLLEFVSDNGNKFRVSPNEDGSGIVVSCRRRMGYDQLEIWPKYANLIEIK